MRFCEINDSFNKQFNIHRSLYEEELVRVLKELGIYDTDVILNQTGKRGKLSIEVLDYEQMQPELVFLPYTKNGTLSTKYNRIYVLPELLEQDLLKHITKVD